MSLLFEVMLVDVEVKSDPGDKFLVMLRTGPAAEVVEEGEKLCLAKEIGGAAPWLGVKGGIEGLSLGLLHHYSCHFDLHHLFVLKEAVRLLD